MDKKAQGEVIIGLFVLVLVGGLVILMLGFDTVDASHLGVQVRFGKIRGIQEAGMEWTGLFTHVYQYDLRTRKAVIDMTGQDSAVDKTGQDIYAKIHVNFRVKPSKETISNLYKNVGTDDVISDRLNIDAIIREGFKQATVKYEALEILGKRQEVKEKAKENIRKNFPTKYFEIENIVVTNIDFSKGFKDAIEQKKIAEQDAIKEENQLQVVVFQQQQKIEEYKALAEQIKLQSSALTDLTIKQKLLERWDGSLPLYLIMPPDSTGMFMQLARGDLTQGNVGSVIKEEEDVQLVE